MGSEGGLRPLAFSAFLMLTVAMVSGELVAGRLVAIGGWSLSRTPEESPKPSYALLWVSDDGVTWRPLASGSGLTGSAGGAAVLGDRIIVTSRDSSGRRMFVGTLSP